MNISPRGKPPVLNSRSWNSIVLIEAVTARSSKPSLTVCLSTSRTSGSTLSMSAAFTPFSPMPYVLCSSSSDSPPPTRSSPSPDSVSAFASLDADVPSSRWSRMPHASESRSESGSSLSSQLTEIMCLSAVSSLAGNRSFTVHGSERFFCQPISESGGCASNSDRYWSSSSSRAAGGSSP